MKAKNAKRFWLIGAGSLLIIAVSAVLLVVNTSGSAQAANPDQAAPVVLSALADSPQPFEQRRAAEQALGTNPRTRDGSRGSASTNGAPPSASPPHSSVR